MALGGRWTVLRRRPGRLTATTDVDFDQRRTRFLHREITGAAYARLRHACECRGVTLVDATAAVLLTAVARDADPERARVYGIGFPTQLRGHLLPGAAHTEAGAYVTMVPTYARYDPNAPIWPIAQEIGADLARRMARGEHLSGLRLLGLLCPRSPATSRKALRLMEDKGPGNVWLYSAAEAETAGALDSWRVSQPQFVCGASVSSYLMVSVSSEGGRLHLNFAYAAGILTPARAHAIAEEVTDLLSRSGSRTVRDGYE